MTEPLKTADIQLIQRILPHRYPFLLVDKVVDIDGYSSAKGIKNVTMNEPHFQGHFPGTPIMPGVTIVEAMAQTSGVMIGVAMDLADKDLLIYFMKRNNKTKSTTRTYDEFPRWIPTPVLSHSPTAGLEKHNFHQKTKKTT